MDVQICKDESEWTQAAIAWLRRNLDKHHPKKVFLPAGNTAIPLYREMEKHPPPQLKGVRLLQVDEILTGPKAGEFRRFFESQLPSFQSQFEWIEEGTSTAEISLLGIGMNGHVAYHEPGLPANFTSGCTQLTKNTCDLLGVGPTWGVTYGAGTFLRSKSVLMLVRGEAKRAILNEALKPDSKLPAAQMFKHADVTLLTDFKF